MMNKRSKIIFNQKGILTQRTDGGQFSFEQMRGRRKGVAAPSYYYFWDSLQAHLRDLIPPFTYQTSKMVRISLLDAHTKERLWGVAGSVCRSPEDNVLLLIGGTPPELFDLLKQNLVKYVGQNVRLRIKTYG